ncbi:pyruvate kinase [Sphaeroforma arctica JP610]|uniref:Pyruvate kinase n=1 Tax=Sphaeroforma arctica JP610 TaxID=667725 RepID=A0A0L0G5W1_9EUKA|nr:pyruvate kinase [Sphaeroforma arctica JP610]KNC84417.1 pyruvate kinase [Sphaeroforma arctica JP610]|eukprot:XP_014158319.1 pyruvate kinase [Sphaeroforma arctica JP610]
MVPRNIINSLLHWGVLLHSGLLLIPIPHHQTPSETIARDLIAKIENHEGLKNFDSILAESDGILVGRGHMGVEIPPEKMFLAQKMMLAKCNLAGKPSICATQMFESMTKNPRPTRAEVSDVANAVLDGADCVMLSGEISRGKYHVSAVAMMHRVCTEAESAMFYRPLFNELMDYTRKRIRDTEETVAIAAVNAAYSQSAAAIICLTSSGRTAAYVSKYRPECPVLTPTRHERVTRQLHLYRSIFPMRYPHPKSEVFQDEIDSTIHWCISEAKGAGYLRANDTVIAIQGWRDGVGHTNTIRILICS